MVWRGLSLASEEESLPATRSASPRVITARVNSATNSSETWQTCPSCPPARGAQACKIFDGPSIFVDNVNFLGNCLTSREKRMSLTKCRQNFTCLIEGPLEKKSCLNPNRIRWRGASRAAAPTTMGNLKRGRGAGVGLGRSSSRADRRQGGRGVSLSLSLARARSRGAQSISVPSLSLTHSACFRPRALTFHCVS